MNLQSRMHSGLVFRQAIIELLKPYKCRVRTLFNDMKRQAISILALTKSI
jgi:hypothetical protein